MKQIVLILMSLLTFSNPSKAPKQTVEPAVSSRTMWSRIPLSRAIPPNSFDEYSFLNIMLEDIIRLLHEGKHSLVVSNGEVRTFDRRGVADLYALLQEDSDFLKGASVADKVVGKAAAALMILGEVGELHADVVSRPTLDLFADSGVRVSYGTAVPHIINRTKTGWCPLETCCRYCLTPQDCLVRIEEFITLQSKRMNSDK